MKKLASVIMGIVFCLFVVTSASADLEGNATAHVWVDVEANVAVGVLSSQVDIGGVQMGDFDALINFRVDANMEDVYLQPFASNLYKGDDPENDDVAPILVNVSEGIEIMPTSANPTNGSSNIATLVQPGEINGFPAFEFSPINFESSQNGHFSQDVTIKVTWTQDDPEKPQGEYSGYVALYCMLMPPNGGGTEI